MKFMVTTYKHISHVICVLFKTILSSKLFIGRICFTLEEDVKLFIGRICFTLERCFLVNIDKLNMFMFFLFCFIFSLVLCRNFISYINHKLQTWLTLFFLQISYKKGRNLCISNLINKSHYNFWSDINWTQLLRWFSSNLQLIGWICQY